MAEGFIGGYMEGMAWKQDRAMNELTMQKLGLEVKATEEDYNKHKSAQEAFAKKLSDMEQKPGDAPTSITAPAKLYAQALYEAGLPVEAATQEKAAIELETSQTDLEIKHIEQGQKAFQGMAADLDAIKKSANPTAEYELYKKRYLANNPALSRPENASMFQGVMNAFKEPYSPGLIDRMLNEGMTRKQLLDEQKGQLDMKKTQVEIQESYARVREINATTAQRQLQNTALRRELGDEGMGEDAMPPEKELAPVINHVSALAGKGGLTKEQAADLAVPIYRDMKRLQKSGMKYDEALRAATKQHRSDIDAMVTVGERASSGQTADELIDELITMADQKVRVGLPGIATVPLPVTGGGGMVARVSETISGYTKGLTGFEESTVAHEFESKTTMLRTLLNRQINSAGRTGKDEREAMKKVVRGLNLGDTPENVKAALEDLKTIREKQKAPLAKSTATLPRVMSNDDYAKVGNGEDYIAPDGTIRTKQGAPQ